jgi:hypothetical protein
VYVSAALPQRAPKTCNPGAASAFLFPELLAGSSDISPSLRRRGSRALIGEVTLHSRINQRFVERRSKHFVGQLNLADLFALQILYLHNRHIVSKMMRKA